jgi:hypothetical protein
MSGWSDEFMNALSWFAAAPKKLVGMTSDAISSGLKNVSDVAAAAAEWVWVVLQGDFAEDPSTAQIVTGTIISMIPFVDQICDVRDIVANAYGIYNHDEEKDGPPTWKWVALVLTLIGLFPSLGSLAKGCLKVLFKSIRKGLNLSVGKAVEAIWRTLSPYVDKGIVALNHYLTRPIVREMLAVSRIDNIYKHLAKEIRNVMATKLNPAELLGTLDVIIGKTKEMLAFVQKHGSEALGTKVMRLIGLIDEMRKKADAKLAEVLKPAQDLLDRIAKRLDDEHNAAYKAATNAHNPRKAFVRVKGNAEVEAYNKERPGYVSELVDEMPHQALDDKKFEAAWEQATADRYAGRISQQPPDLRQAGPLEKAYETFSDLRADVLPEGTVIYRIVDPSSGDNSICWLSKAEFDKLRSKDDWRKNFAVWVSWNRNGEFVTYTVPDGGLPVWRGTTASQKLGNHMLEGGAEQIVLDPKQLDERFMNARQPTNWGYDDAGFDKVDLTGVPTLKRNWLVGRTEEEEAEYHWNRARDQWDE